MEEGWTFEKVEARLIEAVWLWRRTPRDGAWPFAGDGPWHLIKADASDELRPLPLSAEEVAVRDEVTGWVVAHVEKPGDRQLLWRVVGIKAGGHTVSWRRLSRREGERIGRDALRKRYTRAVAAICRGLGGEVASPTVVRVSAGERPLLVRRRASQEYVIVYCDARKKPDADASKGAENRG